MGDAGDGAGNRRGRDSPVISGCVRKLRVYFWRSNSDSLEWKMTCFVEDHDFGEGLFFHVVSVRHKITAGMCHWAFSKDALPQLGYLGLS